MARTMRDDNTEIYRMRVSFLQGNGKQGMEIYGPHDQSNQARNHYWTGFTVRREEKQMLRPDENGQLYWHTIRTKYFNGGEGVEWDR